MKIVGIYLDYFIYVHLFKCVHFRCNIKSNETEQSTLFPKMGQYVRETCGKSGMQAISTVGMGTGGIILTWNLETVSSKIDSIYTSYSTPYQRNTRHSMVNCESV